MPRAGPSRTASRPFGPGDIQASVDPNVTFYSHTSNSSIGTPETDMLFLTKNNASTFTYVGAGFSIRSYDGTVGNQNLAATAFTYGIATPDAAVPRVGAVTFSTRLLGGIIHNDIAACSPCGNNQAFVARLTGFANIGVNFGSGAMTLDGVATEFDRVNGAPHMDIQFHGTGTLAASSNNFGGTFIYGPDNGGFNGNWLGRFYGPGAEEIGAPLYAVHSTSPGTESLIATLIGKRGSTGLGIDTSYDGYGGWNPGTAIPADVAAAIGPRAGAPAADAARQSRLPGGTIPAEVRGALRETHPVRDSQR